MLKSTVSFISLSVSGRQMHSYFLGPNCSIQLFLLKKSGTHKMVLMPFVKQYTYWLTSLFGWVVSFIVYLHREQFSVLIWRSLCSPWLHIWHGWAALRRGWCCAEDTQLHASFLLFGCTAAAINSTTSWDRLEEIKRSFIWVCVPISSLFSVWFSRVTAMILSILF